VTKSPSNKRTRSDKFPLTLHPTGQYCKKIKGKLYYFGADKKDALQRYLEQAAFLNSGKSASPSSVNSQIPLRTLCNLYLTHQESRVASGEIRIRQLHDQTRLLRSFVKYLGPNLSAANSNTMDRQNYRSRLVRAAMSAATINNHVSAIKARYPWAFENEVILALSNLKAIKKISTRKDDKPVFSTDPRF